MDDLGVPLFYETETYFYTPTITNSYLRQIHVAQFCLTKIKFKRSIKQQVRGIKEKTCPTDLDDEKTK